MKKPLSPAIIIGAIAALAAIVVLAIVFAVKSDPAAQAPNEAPRFDPAAKAAESRSDPHLNRALPGR